MNHEEFVEELRDDWEYRFWETVYAPWFFIQNTLLRLKIKRRKLKD